MRQHPLLAGLAEVCRNWGWFLALGVGQLILGTFALVASGVMTIATVLLLGWLVVVGGVFEAVVAFWARQWSGFFLHLVAGVLYIVFGGLMLAHPVGSAAGFTLLIAAMLLTSGVFRIIAAASIQHPNWGWAALDGAVSVALGLLIWVEWPASALWVIGTFVGIDMIFRGWAWVMFGLAARRLCKSGAAAV